MVKRELKATLALRPSPLRSARAGSAPAMRSTVLTPGSGRLTRRSSSTTTKRARARPSSSSMASARAPLRGGTWRPSLPRRHRVIAVDLKGFGQSDKPFDGRYSVFDQAELLAQLIEDKDLRDLTLVGHSFGGGVALLLALEANQRLDGRITRLVLLDSIAYPQNIPVFFRLLDVPLVSQIGVRMVPPSVQTRVALQIAYFDDSKIDPEEVETLCRAAQDRGRQARHHPQRAADRAGGHRRALGALQDDRAADADPVVRPRPHRAARSRASSSGARCPTPPCGWSRIAGTCRRKSSRPRRSGCSRASSAADRTAAPLISLPYRADRQIRFALMVRRTQCAASWRI